MATQGAAGILRAKKPPFLQDRHDEVDEGVELLGKEGRHHVEAVGCAGDEPTFQHVSDLHRLSLVIKAGRMYDPAQIEQSLGITPRAH